jgi:hypothetical protein
MPDCNYCSESFDDEEEYLDHLHADHDESELSRIDRRRVEQHMGTGDGGDLPTGPLIIVGILVFTGAVLVYVTFFVGVDGPPGGNDVAQTPYGLDTAHGHGTIDVTIDGQTLDFSRQRYQLEDDAFHFEGGDGDVWHTHAQGVTLEYAMSTLGIDVNSTSVTFEGETYSARDPNTEVIIEVNGNSVNPKTYVLDGAESVSNADRGDHVRIVVRRTGDRGSTNQSASLAAP